MFAEETGAARDGEERNVGCRQMKFANEQYVVIQ